MRIVVDYDNYFVAGSLAEYVECEHGTCQEYTGAIPSGFSSYEDWFINCECRNAYKLVKGDLVLDLDKLAEINAKINQETIDNTPLLRKDLYGTNEVLNSQYQKATAIGKVLTLSNVKNIPPRVRLTNINCYSYSKINVISTGKNILPNEATTKTINGVYFIKNTDGSIFINGTATEDIEYNIAGTSTNTSPFLVFKKGFNYYLSCGYTIKMYNYNGTDRTQVYSDTGGLINFSDEDKKITQVVLSIPSGTTINNITIFPMLNLGTKAEGYETAKINILEIDFTELIEKELLPVLHPSNDLYPSDDLYPLGVGIDYIIIENGRVYISKNGWESILCAGNVQLFNGNNIVYVDEDINIDIEYNINTLKVEEVFNSKIERTEKEIILNVSSTYETKENASKQYSQIKQTAYGITSEVSKKVGNDEVISKINQTAEAITIDANRININGTVSANGNFKIDTDGNMECKNASVSGKITATEGMFENCTITNSCTVPASTVNGVLNSNNIPNISASKINSGTMSGDRINGGEITASGISALAIKGDYTVGVGEYGNFAVGKSVGISETITVPISITVDGNGRVTGQTWRRLVFKGGILVDVQSSW